MNTHNPEDRHAKQPAERGTGPVHKKPYEKPAFRHEQVFETMALACGKVQSTQGPCHSNRKNS